MFLYNLRLLSNGVMVTGRAKLDVILNRTWIEALDLYLGKPFKDVVLTKSDEEVVAFLREFFEAHDKESAGVTNMLDVLNSSSVVRLYGELPTLPRRLAGVRGKKTFLRELTL